MFSLYTYHILPGKLNKIINLLLKADGNDFLDGDLMAC